MDDDRVEHYGFTVRADDVIAAVRRRHASGAHTLSGSVFATSRRVSPDAWRTYFDMGRIMAGGRKAPSVDKRGFWVSIVPFGRSAGQVRCRSLVEKAIRKVFGAHHLTGMATTRPETNQGARRWWHH